VFVVNNFVYVPWFSYNDNTLTTPEAPATFTGRPNPSSRPPLPPALSAKRFSPIIIHSCFSNSSSLYIVPSATFVHSSLNLSSMIFGLAASILRMWRAICEASLFDTRLQLLRDEALVIWLMASDSSDGHSHSSGGFHDSLGVGLVEDALGIRLRLPFMRGRFRRTGGA
jgi:hypothetical protein